MAGASKYVSKRYLSEKWEKLKWDMEHVVLEGEGDNVVEEVIRVRFELLDLMDSIRKEIEG